MIPFTLDYVIAQTLGGGTSEEQRLLGELSGVRLSRAEAAAEWPHVLDYHFNGAASGSERLR